MKQPYFFGINVNVTFKTATGFRKSLDARLQARAAKTGKDIQCLRRKVAFDRFLARIFHQDTSSFYLSSVKVEVEISWGDNNGPNYSGKVSGEVHDDKGNSVEVSVRRDNDGETKVNASAEHNADKDK
jgi:hypothetical protein